MKIKELTIYYGGDPSVGIPAHSYLLKGPFIFEDEANLQQFKDNLSEAFEYVEDGKPGSIVTNTEYEAWEAQEAGMDKYLADLEDKFYREVQDGELYFL